MDPAQQILKKTYPGDIEQNVKAIETLIGKDKAALTKFHAKQHLPFDVFEDVPEKQGDLPEKVFLKCYYNEADKAYRSPWTNRYYKVGKNDAVDVFERDLEPEEKELREIEIAANEVWDAYTQLYYGSDAIGSVFLKLRDNYSFEGIFGIRKRADQNGSWDSVHVVQVDMPNKKEETCEYKVESAVVCSVNPYKKTYLSSSFTKETTKTCKIRTSGITGSHLENLGLMMEQVEIDFRSQMERVSMPKTFEVMESVYRKSRSSGTAHLMGGGGGGPPMMGTGMGVGAGMIGEIANAAKKKQAGAPGGRNPFMEAMQQNLKAREANKDKDAETAGLFDMKTTLKKSGGPGASSKKPAVKTNPIAAEFMDFRKNLKKTSK